MNRRKNEKGENDMEEPRLYVLVRRDLPMSQQVVQSGHAVAEWLIRGPKTKWKNGTLIVLGVTGVRALKSWQARLEGNDVPYRIFREPDLGDQPTALAAVHTGEIFKPLKLL